ncbi:MAG TPA: hypothetical protein ENN67_03935 [Firmicutes bacterium]|nr:hypothetical protein [Bacillota bacterium]
MKKLLNVLYVQTQGAYLRLDHETIVMEIEGKTARQMPLHPLSAIAVYGNIMLSPHLIAKCASEGRTVAAFDFRGRFQYRIEGPVSGNVLLRRAQHEALSNKDRAASIARNMLAGKIQNCRQVLLRGARESDDDASREILTLQSKLNRPPIRGWRERIKAVCSDYHRRDWERKLFLFLLYSFL